MRLKRFQAGLTNADMLYQNRYLLYVAILFAYIVFHGALLYRIYKINELQASVPLRIEKILEIGKLVGEINNELLGIIGLYDPAKAVKVEFDEGRQYTLLRQIRNSIRLVQKEVTDEDILLELQLLERTVDSLARNIDFLKGQFALQEFDVSSTEIFFKNSIKAGTLKDSYVDEMEQQIESIQTIMRLIQERIASYLAKEFIALRKANNLVHDEEKNFFMASAVGTLAIFFTATILLRPGRG